mmetsp:Transcript_18618/g.37682  ORF Transcript_18618/g.37682 Transcript_18618/m.37682 type:complete len:124 (-) Transcript_18618:405-776(-)
METDKGQPDPLQSVKVHLQLNQSLGRQAGRSKHGTRHSDKTISANPSIDADRKSLIVLPLGTLSTRLPPSLPTFLIVSIQSAPRHVQIEPNQSDEERPFNHRQRELRTQSRSHSLKKDYTQTT